LPTVKPVHGVATIWLVVDFNDANDR